MNWIDFKRAASDFFTPAELIELLDIDTAELIQVLEENTVVFDEDTVEEIEELMGVRDE